VGITGTKLITQKSTVWNCRLIFPASSTNGCTAQLYTDQFQAEAAILLTQMISPCIKLKCHRHYYAATNSEHKQCCDPHIYVSRAYSSKTVHFRTTVSGYYRTLLGNPMLLHVTSCMVNAAVVKVAKMGRGHIVSPPSGRHLVTIIIITKVYKCKIA